MVSGSPQSDCSLKLYVCTDLLICLCHLTGLNAFICVLIRVLLWMNLSELLAVDVQRLVVPECLLSTLAPRPLCSTMLLFLHLSTLSLCRASCQFVNVILCLLLQCTSPELQFQCTFLTFTTQQITAGTVTVLEENVCTETCTRVLVRNVLSSETLRAHRVTLVTAF